MINLLPPEIKENYRYARRNHVLSHWVSIFAVTLLGTALLTAAGVLYLNNTTNTYTKQIDTTNKQLNAQNLAVVQKQVTDISNNLKLVVQVLSKEILFSSLLKQLGTVTPSNVILTNLAISQATGAIDITAQTTDYNAATQLQVNLSDPKNQIFNRADIESINCSSGGTVTSKYPCTLTIRALFATPNPFLFIHSSTKAAS